MTLSELSYNIKNLAAGGQGNNDDSTLKIKQIEFWIRAYRAVGVLSTTEYGKKIDSQLVQDLGAVPLVEVDMADPSCPLEPEWGCTIKKFEIPKLIDFPNNRAMTFIGKIDKRTPFVIDSADVTIFKESTVFGKVLNRAYPVGQTIYVRLYGNDRDMEYINFRGVFEDPTVVNSWATIGCDPVCYNKMTDEYPMPLSMYDFVTTSIMQKELNMTIQTKDDEMNNAKDEAGIEQPVKG
jgi:hypothetical protein